MLQPVMMVPSRGLERGADLEPREGRDGVLARAPGGADQIDAGTAIVDQSRPMMPSSSAMNWPRTRRAVSITSA